MHNALTRIPDHHRSLHGELIGFGLLVQAVLDGAGDAALAARVAWMARLGVDASLEGLGCGGYASAPGARPRLARCGAGARARLPEGTDERALARAIDRADRVARRRPGEAPGTPTPSPSG